MLLPCHVHIKIRCTCEKRTRVSTACQRQSGGGWLWLDPSYHHPPNLLLQGTYVCTRLPLCCDERDFCLQRRYTLPPIAHASVVIHIDDLRHQSPAKQMTRSATCFSTCCFVSSFHPSHHSAMIAVPRRWEVRLRSALASSERSHNEEAILLERGTSCSQE